MEHTHTQRTKNITQNIHQHRNILHKYLDANEWTNRFISISFSFTKKQEKLNFTKNKNQIAKLKLLVY